MANDIDDHFDLLDPLTQALLPAEHETPEERMVRLQQEAEARRVSAEIDAQIEREKRAMKSANTLKMLLLGQSGSGQFTKLPDDLQHHD